MCCPQEFYGWPASAKIAFMLNHDFQELIKVSTGAKDIFHIEDIQSLWSGYGKIMRYGLSEANVNSVVVKHVKLPEQAHHPRGWNSNLSHQRKVKSYQVESEWYRNYGSACNDNCRIPRCLALESDDDEFLMVLEDLDASGYPRRIETVSMQQLYLCLNWLANFHASFMQQVPNGLWATGTYWHLDTRPDELDILSDKELKAVAKKIDMRLRDARFQTIVHGDAKLANFCFSEDGQQVAAVDFQYVGGGCGMKDVAYFIGSCLYEVDCEQYEVELLNYYFTQLRGAMQLRNSTVNLNDLEQEWRELYPIAWTDFHRFLKGWSPGHWKINSYSERLSKQVVNALKESE